MAVLQVINKAIPRWCLGDVLPQKGDVLPQKGDVLPQKGDVLPQKGDVNVEYTCTQLLFRLAGQVVPTCGTLLSRLWEEPVPLAGTASAPIVALTTL